MINNMENTTNVEPEESHISYGIIFGAVVIFFLGLCFFLYLINNPKSPPSAGSVKMTASPTTTATRTKKGGLVLNTIDGENKKALGVVFDVNIVLDSPQAQITSFDMIVKFDKTKLSLVKSQADMADFSLVSVEDKEGVAIIAFKSPTAKTLHPLDKVTLLTLSFKSKAKGKTVISTVKEEGKRTTKFVDNSSRIFYPETGEIVIEIQ